MTLAAEAAADTMNSQSQIGKRDHYGERPGHGFWLLLAGCVPLIVLFALIALRII